MNISYSIAAALTKLVRDFFRLWVAVSEFWGLGSRTIIIGFVSFLLMRTELIDMNGNFSNLFTYHPFTKTNKFGRRILVGQ